MASPTTSTRARENFRAASAISGRPDCRAVNGSSFGTSGFWNVMS
jgi:hypothetical protein